MTCYRLWTCPCGYSDQILEAFVCTGTDSRNVDDIFDGQKWSILFTVVDDLLCGRRTNSGKSIEFCQRCNVYVNQFRGGGNDCCTRRWDDRRCTFDVEDIQFLAILNQPRQIDLSLFGFRKKTARR